MSNIAIAILAAGASTRMRKSKQSLIFKGQTLLALAVETACATSCRPVLIVCDASDLEVGNLALPNLKFDRGGADLQILINKHRAEGMSSSIKLATRNALEMPNVDGLCFMNCDQPLIKSSSLEILASSFRRGAIVASRINDTVGSPAIFDRCFFNELLMLEGDKGGKAIIRKYPENVIAIEVEGADFDVDTPDDYAELTRQL